MTATAGTYPGGGNGGKCPYQLRKAAQKIYVNKRLYKPRKYFSAI